MNIGDLVQRKVEQSRPLPIDEYVGIILSKQIGDPHVGYRRCVTVFYPVLGKTYDIAESLVEVINESR